MQVDIMQWLWWSLIFCAGCAIGVFFFGGLWLTVNQIEKTRFPGPLFMMSFFGRSLISMLGFYLLIGHQFENAIIAFAGFLLARFVTVRMGRPVAKEEIGQQEVAKKDLFYATKS